MIRRLCYFAIVAMITLYGCEDPTSIGTDLLQGDELPLGSENSFDIKSITVAADPVPVYINNATSFSSYNLGKYSDPIFGEVSSKIVLKIEYNFNFGIPDLSAIYLDSAVMVMSFDTLSPYADLNALHHITVYEATSLPSTDTVLANTNVAFNPVPLASSYHKYAPRDSIRIFDYIGDTLSKLQKPQLRIPLDTTRFLKLFSNFENVNTNIELQDLFKGMLITSEPDAGSLMGLNLGSLASDATGGINGVYFYYHSKSDTTKAVFRMTFSAEKYALFTNGFDSSPNGNALGSQDIGNEMLFVQGLSGPNAIITFSDLEKLQGKAVNYAELEITAASIANNDLSLFPAASQLVLSYKKDGVSYTIQDISDLATPGIAIENGFGGNLLARSGTPLGTYKMNVTKAIKAMLRGEIPNNQLILSTFLRAQRPQRVVLYGAKHPQFPIKLKVAYTNP